jgi:hypothetical protein
MKTRIVPKNITYFKKGDIITRIENAKLTVSKFNENLGIETQETAWEDNSYRGDPLEFIDIENNIAYLRARSGLKSGKILRFELGNGWEEGWDYFVDVVGEITNDDNNSNKNNDTEDFLKLVYQKPYSYKLKLNFIIFKIYDFYFQNNKIKTLSLFSEKSAKTECDFLNGAFLAGTMYKVFNKKI